MKKITRLLPIAFLLLCGRIYGAGTPAGEPCVYILHPAENAHLAELSSTFVCGSAAPGGTLTINGQPVPIDPGGGFLTMVSLSSGTFCINARLTSGTSVYALTRTILVDGPFTSSPVSPLTIEYVNPNADYLVVTGDEIMVTAKGSPGMEASFSVKGAKGRFKMVEAAAGRGIYNGVYAVGGKDKLKSSKIEVTITDTKKHDKIRKTSLGAISRVSGTAPMVVEISTANAVLHVGPAPSKGNGAGYYMSLPRGTLLRITGGIGDELRAGLTKTKEAWIKSASVKPLPEGTLPGRGIARNFTITGRNNFTEIRIPFGRKIPFELRPDIDRKYIDVVLYGAYSNTDFMAYASTGVVEQVQWFQDDAETLRVRAWTPSAKWWGYDARYEGEILVLEVRNPPPAAAGSKLPLAGLTIAVDAGHSPDTGAVGVTGLLERDANLSIAKILRAKLAALGARVFMTREGQEPVELYDRPKHAWQARADIFISVHNNSLGDGGNPFTENGYEVYYYHPLSFALAQDILACYGEMVGTKSPYKLRDGGLHYGNFAITRAYQMPAVLTESCYMIVPREEAFLRTEQFQSACAEAMAKGIVRYANTMRPVVKPAIKANNPSPARKNRPHTSKKSKSR